MKVNVFNRQKTLKISKKAIQLIAQVVISEEGFDCDEVNINLVNSKTICQIHLDYFDDPTPTDCVSFPMDNQKDKEKFPYCILGEIFVCPAIAQEYAEQHALDPYEETTLYIVHGLLHLMNYDDLNEQDCALMRKAENRHMESLKKRDCP